MRKVAYVALAVGLMIAGPVEAAPEADAAAPSMVATTESGTSDGPTSMDEATERLTDLLFSDAIDRIDFQATTFEEGKELIELTSRTILEIGMPILGDAGVVADKAYEVIMALDGSKAKGMYMTFEKDKQALEVRNRVEAARLGDIVGTTISIIHKEYRSTKISYGDKAANLYKRVRVDPEDTMSLMERYLETVEFVADLSPGERSKYLN